MSIIEYGNIKWTNEPILGNIKGTTKLVIKKGNELTFINDNNLFSYDYEYDTNLKLKNYNKSYVINNTIIGGICFEKKILFITKTGDIYYNNKNYNIKNDINSLLKCTTFNITSITINNKDIILAINNTDKYDDYIFIKLTITSSKNPKFINFKKLFIYKYTVYDIFFDNNKLLILTNKCIYSMKWYNELDIYGKKPKSIYSSYTNEKFKFYNNPVGITKISENKYLIIFKDSMVKNDSFEYCITKII